MERDEEHCNRHFADFAAYLNNLEGSKASVGAFCDIFNGDDEGNDLWYEIAAFRVCWYRRLFSTSYGHVGIGPRAMQIGDRVCILFGHSNPVILRPQGVKYQFMGEAYAHDLMDGQGVEDYISGKQASEEFNLC